MVALDIQTKRKKPSENQTKIKFCVIFDLKGDSSSFVFCLKIHNKANF